MNRQLSAVLTCCTLLASCTSDNKPAVTSPEDVNEQSSIDSYQGGVFLGRTFKAQPRRLRTEVVGRFHGLTLSTEATAAAVASSGGGASGWASHAPMTLPREGACIAGIGDKIYVQAGFGPPFGDSQTLQIYDVASNTWSMGPPATIIRSEGIGVAHGDRLYCIGGRTFGSRDAVEIYHAATNTYSLGAPMPTQRRGLAAAVVGNSIFAIGGSNGFTPQSGTPFDVNEVYDIAADAWSVASPMPTPRMDVVAAAHGGKIYVVGGYNPFLCPPFGTCHTLEIYDPAHDTWSTGAPMPTARGSLAVGTKGNNLYAIAGVTTFFSLSSFNEEYNIAKNTWTSRPLKPTATAETHGVNHGGRIYVIGGGFFGLGFSPVPGAVNESFRP